MTWRDEWCLGIDVLDADHRALIGHLIDISLRFCPQAAMPMGIHGGIRIPGGSVFAGSGPADLVGALAAFGEKVRAHFRREEAFMRAIDYPQAAEHEAEHVALMTEFGSMLREWRAHGITVLDETAQERVRHWLISHVLQSDREFAKVYFELCGLEEPRAERA